jgi:hypothetical protein
LPLDLESLDSECHVIRYVGGLLVDRETGAIDGSGFLRKPNGDHPSVNWVECFNAPIENQLSEIRARKRITYGKTGRLALLNVGWTRGHLAANYPDFDGLDFVKDPLDPQPPRYPLSDPSHALIWGAPTSDTPEGEAIGDLIAETIVKSFEASPIA